MKKQLSLAIAIVAMVSLASCGNATASSAAASEAKSVAASEDAKEEPVSDIAKAESEHKIAHGELLNWNENEIDGKQVLVVKAKISPSFTNELTINQNYMNVADIIKNQGGDAFDEIQYWAVADMQDGSESKVISFTLDSTTIQGIAAGNIVDIELGDYVSDLYILPSLKD